MKTASQLLRLALDIGYSQAELARLLDVDHSRVSRWLSGSTPKHADKFLKLQALLAPKGRK